jgi:hypothetical protein
LDIGHWTFSSSMTGLILAISVLLAVALLGMGILHWIQRGRQTTVASAVSVFATQRAELEPLFLQQAQATGKPRGLLWKQCELAGEPVFARDHSSGEIVALVEATIGFEAIVGSEMEDVEAVGNLRSATAVFVYRRGSWTSDGRAVFNLGPEQALERFSTTLTRIN